jgi:hypothetical protein
MLDVVPQSAARRDAECLRSDDRLGGLIAALDAFVVGFGLIRTSAWYFSRVVHHA